jgi:DNA-binding NarL/FixJ family response regulator
MGAPRPQVWLLDQPPDERTFASRGWDVRTGWSAPSRLGRTALLVGSIDDEASAGRALEAAALGTSFAAHLALTGRARHRFLDDLARLGIEPEAEAARGPTLDADQAQLLDLLAAGETVTGAARLLHVSRRTTNRRLEGARTALGATTTAEAVRAWALRRPPADGGGVS